MLAVLKALGDETRFSMYRELASSTHPLSAHELADRLGIHANTVRLHLERLREAGLVDVEAVHRGTVGRPQHVYALARRARPASGSTRRATRCSPGCSPRSPSGSAPTPTKRPRSAGKWGAEAGRRTALAIVRQGARRRARTARLRPRSPRGRRRRRLDRVPALPVPGAGRGLSRARVQPAPRHLRRRREDGRRGKRRRLRDVVRPRPVPGHGRGRVS